ncbi:MAG: rhodanese-like domain-containing protein [Planctomycetes bacterium]|nr:rhodanese-like domain-containing protein [Planctomycetota bacterium]
MTTQSAPPIRPDQTMAEILGNYPSAKRALFQRYHVGGCSSCAFQMTDTLEQVCRDHNILDVPAVVEHLLRSHEVDLRMQVEPEQAKAWLEAGEKMVFLDLRHPSQVGAARIAGVEPLDFANQAKYMELPKDTRIVFVCQSGMASLDAAAYFAGHGYSQVYSVRGGVDAWRERVDPALPS